MQLLTTLLNVQDTTNLGVIDTFSIHANCNLNQIVNIHDRQRWTQHQSEFEKQNFPTTPSPSIKLILKPIG